MAQSFGKELVNKGVFGVIWLGFIAVIFAIAGSVGIELSANFNELGEAIDEGNLWSLVTFVVAVLIFGVVGLYMAQHSSVFKVFGRSEKDKVEVPKRVGILTILILGGLISIALMVFNWFLNSLGAQDADIGSLVNAFESGDIWGVVVGILVIVVIGYIVFGISHRAKSIQKGVKSFGGTSKIPDGGSNN